HTDRGKVHNTLTPGHSQNDLAWAVSGAPPPHALTLRVDPFFASALRPHHEADTRTREPVLSPAARSVRGPGPHPRVLGADSGRRIPPWPWTTPMTSCRSRTSESSGQRLRPCSAGSETSASGSHARTSAANTGARVIAAHSSSGA